MSKEILEKSIQNLYFLRDSLERELSNLDIVLNSMTNTSTINLSDLKLKTARQIVEHVQNTTGITIKISLKSKKAIIRKALQILSNYYKLIDYSKYGLKLNNKGTYDCEGDFTLPSELIENGCFKIKFGNIKGSFYCSNNELTSLEGSPETVGGNFYCSANKLTSLEGGPETIKANFNCYNNKLTSLEGGPKTVGGYFDCSDNRLIALKGCPNTVRGNFYCHNNKKKFSIEEVKTICNVKHEIYV